MNCLVTGTAGFIGSHLAEKLLELGHSVVGIDCFTDYYPRKIKENNLSSLKTNPQFKFIEADLLKINLKDLLKDVQWIFHQAAQAGVRSSWGKEFNIYVKNNIEATQHLLESAKECSVEKFVYASSSSVYGDAKSYPTKEDALPRPLSPYGVSKLAAEHLCNLYCKEWGVPVVSLRYFTVFGPRQRPDMAFHRFIKAALKKEELIVWGNGEQSRDFTYVSDAVEANILAANYGKNGEVYNVGGGCRATINQVISILKELLGDLKVKYLEPQKGDVKHTRADITKAKKELLFNPKVALKDGLKEEINWIKEQIL
ncbi:MAG: NAD-dependent epimerase/dehydratase family protein [Candidatus Dadabacteria bacterium]|nr:MAG: NAD-dependent epimerase/dehydratase family protein [Candidatus Dadabacteria bacterium]